MTRIIAGTTVRLIDRVNKTRGRPAACGGRTARWQKLLRTGPSVPGSGSPSGRSDSSGLFVGISRRRGCRFSRALENQHEMKLTIRPSRCFSTSYKLRTATFAPGIIIPCLLSDRTIRRPRLHTPRRTHVQPLCPSFSHTHIRIRTYTRARAHTLGELFNVQNTV